MKCQMCDGKGWTDKTDISVKLCSKCNGTGQVEQTNEEWFIGLTMQEKAKFFHGIVIRVTQATWDGKKPDYPAYLSDWKKWLKAVHEE